MSNTFVTPTQRDTSAPPAIAGIDIQTALAYVPIPIVYGTARTAGNVVHLPSGVIQTVNTTTSNTGGKWGADVQRNVYTYTAVLVLAICEGPIVSIGRVWQDQNSNQSWTDFAAGGFTLALGTSAPAVWGTLTTNYPAQAIPYQYTAYVAHPNWPLADGGTLPNYQWEVVGFLSFGGPNLVVDASPADIAYDLWTDVTHGLGLPASLLGSFTAWQNYCAAAGLFCSPVLDTADQPASETFDTLCQISNTAAVWSEGVLKFIPYGDTNLSGNGKTFTANTTPVYALTDADFLVTGTEDPIVVTRTSPADAYNHVTVTYEDRNNATAPYTPSVADAKDLGLIDLYGARTAPAFDGSWVKSSTVAQQIAQLMLQRSGYIRNSYQFKLGWKYCLLEPMDLVTLTDVGLGLSGTVVRVTQVDENEDDSLTITAEDFPGAVSTAASYGMQTGAGTQPNTGVTPPNTVATAFLAPGPLAQAPVEVWIAASGGTAANWGGCDVWVSTDGGTTYRRAGSITSPGTFGTLNGALATGTAVPGTDTTNTLHVDVTPSHGALATVSATDLGNYVSLCYVDGEWVAFQTATLTSGYHYDLTTLKRGVYGSTVPASHASGTTFIRCDSAVFRLPIPNPNLGSTLYLKLPSFNQFGGAAQSVASCTPVTITLPTVATAPVGPPSAFIIPQSHTDATETVKFLGAVAPGGLGPLTYQYKVDVTGAAGSFSASASLPGAGVTQVITRDLENNTTVTLAVTDVATGEVESVVYTVASQGQMRGARALNANSVINQPNIPAVVSANLSAAIQGSSPLSVNASGVVTISAFTMQYGFGAVSYNAGSITSGFTSGTVLYVYALDATLAGGAVTYTFGLQPYSPMTSLSAVYLGKVTVPASGSSGGSGGGGYQ